MTKNVRRSTKIVGPGEAAPGFRENPTYYTANSVLMEPGWDLPDGTKMSVPDRLAYGVSRLSETQKRELFGGEKEKRARDRYIKGDSKKVPFHFVVRLSEASGIPTDWFAIGFTVALSGFELIPRLDVQASAGSGALAADGAAADVVAFRGDWLRTLGINPRFARAIFARGDSMEPTINDGDLLLVDESIDHVLDHGIYVVVYQGMVLVKRVQLRRDGTLVLKSDNKNYDEEEVPPAEVADIHIAGRVRWYGRTI
jgi:hypothetical protein